MTSNKKRIASQQRRLEAREKSIRAILARVAHSYPVRISDIELGVPFSTSIDPNCIFLRITDNSGFIVGVDQNRSFVLTVVGYGSLKTGHIYTFQNETRGMVMDADFFSESELVASNYEI